MEREKLAELLKPRARELCEKLFQNGKLHGHEFHIGDIHGNKGSSLKINLQTGEWCDFSNSEYRGKDLVALLIAINNGEVKAGLSFAHQFLGIPQWRELSIQSKKEVFHAPKCDWHELNGSVREWLVNSRKIPAEVLELCQVKSKDDWYVFLYHTVSGKLCMAKYINLVRTDGKKESYTSKNPAPVLWGMNFQLTENILPDHWIIITSGELDAASYITQGLRAVSIPFGDENDKWIELCWKWLNQFSCIYLSYDMDESGQSAVHRVASRLGLERCKIVKLPYKDANRCHQEGITLEKYISEAKEIQPAKLLSASQIKKDVWDRIKLGRRDEQGIVTMGWDEFKFRIRPRELTIITGYPGGGKSTFLYQLTCYLISIGQKVAVISLEEEPEVVISIMVSQMLGKILDPNDEESEETFNKIYDKAFDGNLYVYGHRGTAPIDDILTFSEYCVRRYGCQHVIIDSAARTDLDIEDNAQANVFANKITQSMNETGAHYWLVAHSRKGDEYSISQIPGQAEIKGSVQFGITAFNIFTVWRNKKKHELLSQPCLPEEMRTKTEHWADAVIKVCKNKVGGSVFEFHLDFNPDNYRFYMRDWPDNEPYVSVD